VWAEVEVDYALFGFQEQPVGGASDGGVGADGEGGGGDKGGLEVCGGADSVKGVGGAADCFVVVVTAEA
jgi:hypothetical protein